MLLRGMADSGPGQEMYNGDQRRESKEATNNHDKVANWQAPTGLWGGNFKQQKE